MENNSNLFQMKNIITFISLELKSIKLLSIDTIFMHDQLRLIKNY